MSKQLNTKSFQFNENTFSSITDEKLIEQVFNSKSFMNCVSNTLKKDEFDEPLGKRRVFHCVLYL